MPYPPPEQLLEAAKLALPTLNRYAEDTDAKQLQEQLAEYADLPAQHIVLSPGSDLLLREIVHEFSKGRKVVTISPSFFPTVQIAHRFALQHISLRLSPPDFKLNPELLIKALTAPSLVIIDNPNNPTGQLLLDADLVSSIIQDEERLLIVDEAYYEFSGVTFANWVPDHPNLCVVRTMDKAFSLAGARVGYAIAGETFLKALSSFYAFMPRISLCVARAALRNRDYVHTNVHRILEERAHVRHALNETHQKYSIGTRIYPSKTNSLLVRTDYPDMAKRLRDGGVLVADVSNQLPSGFIRVSIGNRKENDAFLTIYTEILSTIHKTRKELRA